MPDARVSAGSRVALGSIRLVNGVLGLLVPRLLIRRLDPGDPPSPAAIYFARLFGIRTILIGRDLLTRAGADLDRSLDEAVLVHASDTGTAALLAASGALPRRSGAVLVAISATNTALALLARRARGPATP